MIRMRIVPCAAALLLLGACGGDSAGPVDANDAAPAGFTVQTRDNSDPDTINGEAGGGNDEGGGTIGNGGTLGSGSRGGATCTSETGC